MHKRICIEPECENEAVHLKLSRSGSCHYRWQRAHGKKHTATCTVCASDYTVHRKPRGQPCCSPTCRQAFAQPLAAAAPRQPRLPRPKVTRLTQCAECHSLFVLDSTKTRKTCSNKCATTAARRRAQAQRGPLRTAVEDGDHTSTLRLINERTVADANGCHIWQGRLEDGYPVVQIGATRPYVHRLVLEAKHEALLGVQAAHHMCAVPACVNPKHLQPVTHRDNTAEMLARHTYLNRIAELEQALADVSPGHPALNRIRTA